MEILIILLILSACLIRDLIVWLRNILKRLGTGRSKTERLDTDKQLYSDIELMTFDTLEDNEEE